ncbi:MAG: divergent PAP2 family protein [Clostridiales bacterium]|nr:divergent PAP2 family protein [Clostridiales bacterium]
MLLDFILQYKFITIPFIAWSTAQALKFFFDFVSSRKIDFRRLVGSGGMPSSHSALVVSLATVVGASEGIESATFGLAMAFALVVMYDAAGVRRATGKQAKVLNRMFYHNKDDYHLDEELKELIGHTPVEVIAGALLGLAYGLFFMVVLI